MSGNQLLAPHSSQEEHWIPLSDLMTGLMMFFLLIAICFMLKVEAESRRVEKIAVLYEQTRTSLYEDLESEFRVDLNSWGAELDADLTIRFKEPDVLFSTGSDEIKPKFKNILNDFFPRYISILSSPKYRESIEEIRIEGHTSSMWENKTSLDDAYFKNMALSQSRTRAVLQYVLDGARVKDEKQWLRRNLTANGLSSSKPILNPDNTENRAKSQRVEFRVRTNAEARIATMINAVK